MTGITSSTIHSGRLSLSRIDSTIFRRLIKSFFFCFDPVSSRFDAQFFGQAGPGQAC